jgi:hypothetical protein
VTEDERRSAAIDAFKQRILESEGEPSYLYEFVVREDVDWIPLRNGSISTGEIVPTAPWGDVRVVEKQPADDPMYERLVCEPVD